MYDLIKIESLPEIPENWDYDLSIKQQKKRQGLITNWVNTTREYLDELWIARDMLSISHRPKISGEKSSLNKTWNDYCEDLGYKRNTINGWLNRYKPFEKNNRLTNEKDKRDAAIIGLDIRKGDFIDVLSDVYNIDLIITDPPYPLEFIDCFSDLAEFAKEHLKEDGFCVVYSGQYHLPEVIRRLSEHLTYVWTFCLYHKGKKQLVNGVNIMCGWKPVLIFSNGRKKMRFSAYDVIVSEEMEKHSHEWQQSESGVEKLIEIFSEPGELLVDPFAGSATFLKVANDMGRNAIGAEIK